MIIMSIWPSTVEGWVGLITLICGLIAAIATLVPTFVKLFNTVKELVKEKNWKKITQIAINAIRAAEQSGMSGADKKEMVIAAVKAGCAEAGIELDDEQLVRLADYIDEMIKYFNDMTAATKIGTKAAKKIAAQEEQEKE